MKKVLITIIFLVTSVSLSFAQKYATDEGSILISGMVSYVSQSGNPYESPNGEGTSTRILTPTINYFIIPNLTVGAALSYQSQSTGDFNMSIIGVGPTLSYFFGGPKKKAMPYLGVGFRYNSFSIPNVNNLTGTSIIITGGIVRIVGKHLGIVIEANYYIDSFSRGDADAGSGNKIALAIGLTGFLF